RGDIDREIADAGAERDCPRVGVAVARSAVGARDRRAAIGGQAERRDGVRCRNRPEESGCHRGAKEGLLHHVLVLLFMLVAGLLPDRTTYLSKLRDSAGSRDRSST